MNRELTALLAISLIVAALAITAVDVPDGIERPVLVSPN